MPDSTAGDGFAELLRELKDASGLSYGVLAKRLHMSTSTLHRYCNGDSVPADYAPVERLARLCKATSEQLVELHRRWVLADADRGRKAGDPAPSAPAPTVAPTVAAESGAAVDEVTEPVDDAAERSRGRLPGVAVGRGTGSRRRIRTPLVAAVAAVAVVGGVTLALGLPSDGGRPTKDSSAGAASPQGGKEGGTVSPGGGVSPSVSASGSAAHSSPSAPSSQKKPGGSDRTGAEGKARDGGADTPPPLSVVTRPYEWEGPCGQHYLIDRPSASVAPPPTQDTATAWVASQGAVSSGEQYVAATVQGTGKQTVVVNSLKVRILDKSEPLAWNDFAMGYPGVGCGGGVPTRSFSVALDAARPLVIPEAGHRNFPFKVSESDPEVFYIKADASAYLVNWELELSWSSGSRSGTLRINDSGRPFRTSGNNGRPGYEFPLGGPAWVKAGTTE
ncbi:helix-turn-helix domain-containing protein [Streptomyces sp. NPDC086787]|uniref:helix-turn-helix domain-containing protein n=1 Tax=Streptomyces sp. NPDC086787 TaxID=3365759 RepID=UPI003808A94D